MTSTVRTTGYRSIWSGWPPGWSDSYDWGEYGAYPVSELSTSYSGKVVANLLGPGAQRLRCRFDLEEPATGMRGGGQGECQFTGGRTVSALFPRA